MKQHDVFPGKYLKAADLADASPVVTIDRVTIEDIGDNTSKPVVYFVGKDRGVVLNRTNWNTIEDLSGEPDSDQWPGTRIMLVVRKVEFQGKRVPAIRIEAAPSSGRQATPPPVEREPGEDDDTLTADDIPF